MSALRKFNVELREFDHEEVLGQVTIEAVSWEAAERIAQAMFDNSGLENGFPEEVSNE